MIRCCVCSTTIEGREHYRLEAGATIYRHRIPSDRNYCSLQCVEDDPTTQPPQDAA